MKKEWFEPGADGIPPFTKLFDDYNGSLGESISDAFRALIAQDAAKEPPALAVGDVVRLERYESNPNGLSWFESEAHLIGTEEKISRIYEDGTVWLSVGTSWPVSACTLVRRAGEVDGKQEENRNGLKWFDVHLLHAQLHARNDEIVGLRAEVERWKSIADAHEQNYNMMLKRIDEVAAERDALQARIDAGVPVWGIARDGSEAWCNWKRTTDTHTAILIDAQPIADHLRDATHAAVLQRSYKGRKLDDGTLMLRVGTKLAGNLLDGQEWRQFPR